MISKSELTHESAEGIADNTPTNEVVTLAGIAALSSLGYQVGKDFYSSFKKVGDLLSVALLDIQYKRDTESLEFALLAKMTNFCPHKVFIDNVSLNAVAAGEILPKSVLGLECSGPRLSSPPYDNIRSVGRFRVEIYDSSVFNEEKKLKTSVFNGIEFDLEPLESRLVLLTWGELQLSDRTLHKKAKKITFSWRSLSSDSGVQTKVPLYLKTRR